MNKNLPPGCKSSDLPGNRPEDVSFEKFLDDRLRDLFVQYYDREPEIEESPSEKYDEDEGFKDYVQDRFKQEYKGV